MGEKQRIRIVLPNVLAGKAAEALRPEEKSDAFRAELAVQPPEHWREQTQHQHAPRQPLPPKKKLPPALVGPVGGEGQRGHHQPDGSFLEHGQGKPHEGKYPVDWSSVAQVIGELPGAENHRVGQNGVGAHVVADEEVRLAGVEHQRRDLARRPVVEQPAQPVGGEYPQQRKQKRRQPVGKRRHAEQAVREGRQPEQQRGLVEVIFVPVVDLQKAARLAHFPANGRVLRSIHVHQVDGHRAQQVDRRREQEEGGIGILGEGGHGEGKNVKLMNAECPMSKE